MPSLVIDFNNDEFSIIKSLNKQLKNDKVSYQVVKKTLDEVYLSITKNQEQYKKLCESLNYSNAKEKNLLDKALLRKILNKITIKVKIHSILLHYILKIKVNELEQK